MFKLLLPPLFSTHIGQWPCVCGTEHLTPGVSHLRDWRGWAVWACWTQQPFCTRYQFLVPHKQPLWPQRQVRVKRVREDVASEIILPSYNHICSLLSACSHCDVMWQFHSCCCCVLRACEAACCESLHSLNSSVICRAWAAVVTLWSLFELFHSGVLFLHVCCVLVWTPQIKV